MNGTSTDDVVRDAPKAPPGEIGHEALLADEEWPTTRRFSRCAGEAFRGADYAAALEAPASSSVSDATIAIVMERGEAVEHAFRTYALDHGASPDDWRLSPLLAPDHASLPPALVQTAECDAVRDDGEAYAAKLAQAGVPVSCVRYMGVLHTFFSMRGALHCAAVAQRQVADALRATVVAD
jgi:acetyl esterase/lipase